MSKIELNIYKAGSKTEVEKTLSVEGYDLMFGRVMDFMRLFKLENLNDENALFRTISESYSEIVDFLKDVFPDLTDEDLRRVKVADLIPVIVGIGGAVMNSIRPLNKQKN